MRFSRRTLLKTSAAAGVLGALKPLFADERPMPLRDLGRTGEKVSLAGIGTAEWGAGPADADADRMIARAIDLGINYVDTAPMYGDSESVLGRILGTTDAPLVVSTKLGARPRPFDPKDRAALRASFEESSRLLGREKIDILMIHEPDRPRQFGWWDDFDRAEGPVMDVLDSLRKEGRIRYIGLGGTTAYEMARLLRTGTFDVVLTAFNYSLLWQEAKHEALPQMIRPGRKSS